MRIVRADELLRMPAGTLFQSCDDLFFGALCRLGTGSGSGRDFWYTPLSVPQYEEALQLVHYPCSEERHGVYHLQDAHFLVWEAADVALLQRQLQGETLDGLDNPAVSTLHATLPL